ncbi:hypothetical protein F4814DRAFT_458301 [Daldinia grandis]|nr:hypothetical protein F4814DRAFT_458301 [Daldinia grandis]
MEPWTPKAMTEIKAVSRPYAERVDPRKASTQPAKPSLARDTLLLSHFRARAIGSLTSEDSRWHIPIIDSSYNIQGDIEDPESDIESAPGRSFSSTSPLSSSPSPSLCTADHPPSSTEFFSERVNNTPYTSQTQMFRFRQKESFMDWNPLITSLKQGVPGDLRYQNDRYRLIDYGGSSSVWGAAFTKNNAATSSPLNTTHNQGYQCQMLDRLKLRIAEVVRQVLKKYTNQRHPVDPFSLTQYCSPSHSATQNRRQGSPSQGQPAKRAQNRHGNRALRDRDGHDSEPEDEPADGNGGDGNLVHTGPSEQPLYFACPFYQRNPERFAQISSCAFTSYAEISRLKEHLKRVHRIFRCLRCQQSYHTEEEVERHLQQDDICNRQAPIVCDESYDWSEGYGQTQAEKLKARWRNLLDDEKWIKIYRILFPCDRNTPWPYASQSSSPHLLGEPDVTPESATSLNTHLPERVLRAVLDGVYAVASIGVNSSLDTSSLPLNQPQTGLPGYCSAPPTSSSQFYEGEPSSNIDEVPQADYSMFVNESPYLPNPYLLGLQPQLLVKPSNLTGDSTYYTNLDISSESSQPGMEFDPPGGPPANGDELGYPAFEPLGGPWDVTGDGYPQGEGYADDSGVFDSSQSQ